MAGLFAVAAALIAPAAAGADPYAPPDGRAYHGVSDTGSIADFETFSDQVGAHPALLQDFFHWRVPLTTGALYRWGKTNTRGVLSLSTATGDGVEMITPRQIAKGKDDRYMTHMAADIAETGQTVYIRLMAEMNGHWNAYSAFNADGSARRHGHSARWYRLAWRRFTLILRGGSRDKINRKLMRMGLPRIIRAKSQDDPVYEGGPDGIPLPIPEHMPEPRVAMMWVPQSFGSPNIRGNQPADYWPGGKYVDWVGIDIYSKFAGAFDDGVAFFNRYDKWPFVIGEYGPWDNDVSGALHGRPAALGRGARPGQGDALLPRGRPRQQLQPPVLSRRPSGASQPPRRAALEPVRAGRQGPRRPARAAGDTGPPAGQGVPVTVNSELMWRAMGGEHRLVRRGFAALLVLGVSILAMSQQPSLGEARAIRVEPATVGQGPLEPRVRRWLALSLPRTLEVGTRATVRVEGAANAGDQLTVFVNPRGEECPSSASAPPADAISLVSEVTDEGDFRATAAYTPRSLGDRSFCAYLGAPRTTRPTFWRARTVG